MKNWKKNITLFIIFGCMYLIIELFMRMVRGELVGVHGLSYMSLAGWTSIWMFPIGGSCIFIIGYMNEKWTMPIWLQVLLGTIFVFTIEFLTGLIFNVWFDLHLWDYSSWPANIMGQITLIYLPVWGLLCPIGIWIDDLLRHVWDKKEFDTSLLDIYKALFTGR